MGEIAEMRFYLLAATLGLFICPAHVVEEGKAHCPYSFRGESPSGGFIERRRDQLLRNHHFYINRRSVQHFVCL